MARNSAFDPETFLSTTYDKQLDTKRVPVPENEYTATVDSLGAREIQFKDGTVRRCLDVTWAIDDSDGEVQKITKRDKNTVRQSIFLDMTEEGALDMSAGANVDLGRLRDALGQNRAGKPWSFQMLIGQVARIQVSHRHDAEKDETYTDVKRVSPIG